jgi:hypothetical protein
VFARQYPSLSVLVKTQVLLGRDDPQRVGMAHTTPPALHTDHGIALGQHTQLDGVGDAPLEAGIDILLPRGGLEVGLLLRVVEGVHATVEVRIPAGAGIACHHDDGTDGTVLGDEAGGVAAVMSHVSSHPQDPNKFYNYRWPFRLIK